MNSRVTLNIKMELLSDAIFGSGNSIPGGEDIAVCTDSEGYPYLKGTALKGMLRESLINWLCWTGGNQKLIDILFGNEDWNGEAENRRLQLGSLELSQRPAESESCFGKRYLTSLENGIVKTGSLRMAACIRRGLVFSGKIFCAEEDADLITKALACIKTAGAMTNRGFGQVEIHSELVAEDKKAPELKAASCIHYRLHTELPVMITDISHSYGNSYNTQDWIPGTAVRGLVMSRLSNNNPKWFEEHKAELLQKIKFLDAAPDPEHRAVLPAIKGFYEDKGETILHSVLEDGIVPSGMKRAKLGRFNSIEDGTISFWSAKTNGINRIKRGIASGEDSIPFETRYIEADQDFDGYIIMDNPALADKISETLTEALWLGADRYEGFGKCRLSLLEAADAPAWQASYGHDENHLPGKILYLLAVSPFTMLDKYGEPCGLNMEELEEMLGVKFKEDKLLCSTSLSEYGCYNRRWQCREPLMRMYDRGSIFKLECDSAPELNKLISVQKNGLGIRSSEGFGQVLFIRPDILESVEKKQALRKLNRKNASAVSQLRRKKYMWIEKQCDRGVLSSKLSASQLGSIQSLLEKAGEAGGDTSELRYFINKNLEERGAKHADSFRAAAEFIIDVLESPLEKTLHISCGDSMEDRIDLLCKLIDHSRKER